MRVIEWIDEDGYKRRKAIRDNDLDEMAEQGLPLEPPNLDVLDWANLKRSLHNNLLDRGLTSWKDVQYSKNGVTSAILATFRREVIALYKGGAR